MALITLGSAKGAPGVTTTALGLALNWGKDCLLVEADISGSSILAGYQRGEKPHDKGLVQVAMARMQMPLMDAIFTQATALTSEVKFLPGFANPNQAGALGGAWGDFGSAFRSLEQAGIDVIVDLGRIAARAEERDALITLADQHLILTGSSLPAVYTTREFTQRYRATMDMAADIMGTAVVVVGPNRPYGPNEISRACSVPLAGVVDWDPKSAAVYATGATQPRSFKNSSLNRSLTALAGALRERVARRRQQLQGAVR